MGRRKMTEKQKAAMQAARSSANKTVIPINPKWRIYAVDKRNWALQRNSGTDANGETVWISQYFHETLKDSLRSLARRLVNKELRFNGDLESLSDVIKRIEKAENKVYDMLQGMVDDDSDDDEEAA